MTNTPTFSVQQSWEEDIEVQAFDEQDRPVKFRFRYLDIVGNGTFGIVCRARCLDDGRLCAIKTVYQDEGHQVTRCGLDY